MKYKIRKYSMTLLEIMIVIFLIGLIGTVVGYNMKGSLDRGKAFKTEQAQLQVKDILYLQIENGFVVENIQKDAKEMLDLSGLVRDPEGLLKDGWGKPFKIEYKKKRESKDKEIFVTSEKLNNYLEKKEQKTKKIEDVENEYEY